MSYFSSNPSNQNSEFLTSRETNKGFPRLIFGISESSVQPVRTLASLEMVSLIYKTRV